MSYGKTARIYLAVGHNAFLDGDEAAKETLAELAGVELSVVHRVDLMPNYGTTQDLATADNAMYRFEFGMQWVDAGPGSGSPTYHWYVNAANGNHLALIHESNYLYVDGRAPDNHHYSTYYGAGMPGGDNSWCHGSRLLVRQVD